MKRFKEYTRLTRGFAIGGIEISNAREVLSTGVTGIAVINGILSYQNSSDRVNKFNEILENFS